MLVNNTARGKLTSEKGVKLSEREIELNINLAHEAVELANGGSSDKIPKPTVTRKDSTTVEKRHTSANANSGSGKKPACMKAGGKPKQDRIDFRTMGIRQIETSGKWVSLGLTLTIFVSTIANALSYLKNRNLE